MELFKLEHILSTMIEIVVPLICIGRDGKLWTRECGEGVKENTVYDLCFVYR